MEKIPDHVQLRLRMSEKQINEQRELDRKRGADAKEDRALFNSIEEGRWDNRVRRRDYVRPRSSFDYNYYARLYRDIASRKVERNIAKYWRRQARKLEEKANEQDK